MWIISWIALIILILFGFFAYKEMRDYTNIIKLNWWIQIPKEANVEEIYSKDSWESFHWDGIRYHVYSYENEEVVESMVNWLRPHSDTVVVPNTVESIGIYSFGECTALQGVNINVPVISE